MMNQRYKTLQKYCSASSRVLASVTQNCSSSVKQAFKDKLRWEIVRLLLAERVRSSTLEALVAGVTTEKLAPWDLWSSKPKQFTPQEAASMLKKINLEVFMENLFNAEIAIMNDSLMPEYLPDIMAMVWQAMVEVMEEVVLGNAGLLGGMSPADAQLLSKLAAVAWEWFHSDGEGVPAEMLSATLRLKELLDLHPKPISVLELKYNSMWTENISANAATSEGAQAADGGQSKQRALSDSSHQMAWPIHLYCILRQRESDPNTSSLMEKILAGGAKHPMEVYFGEWGEQVLGKWGCHHRGSNSPGTLCVTRRFLGFAAIGSGLPSGRKDIFVLLRLSQMTRMNYKYERSGPLPSAALPSQACSRWTPRTCWGHAPLNSNC